jgi:hypothetical protein
VPLCCSTAISLRVDVRDNPTSLPRRYHSPQVVIRPDSRIKTSCCGTESIPSWLPLLIDQCKEPSQVSAAERKNTSNSTINRGWRSECLMPSMALSKIPWNFKIFNMSQKNTRKGGGNFNPGRGFSGGPPPQLPLSPSYCLLENGRKPRCFISRKHPMKVLGQGSFSVLFLQKTVLHQDRSQSKENLPRLLQTVPRKLH